MKIEKKISQNQQNVDCMTRSLLLQHTAESDSPQKHDQTCLYGCQ